MIDNKSHANLEKFYTSQSEEQAKAHDELIPSEVVKRISELEQQVVGLQVRVEAAASQNVTYQQLILDLLTKMSTKINSRIEWEEDTTNAGIQLSGNTRVKKQGRLLAINTQILGQNAVATITTVVDDNNTVLIINSPWKFVE